MRVSAIVSLYKAERFVQGAMEDLVAQTLFRRGEMEIIVINSGSPENEDPVVLRYCQQYANIKYVRTERETIYAAWNRGVRMAAGTYLTNANADDRHRCDALECLAAALDRSGAGVAYADAYITRGPNETFERNRADRVFNWPDFSLRQMMMQSLVGPQPMWCRKLHDEVGLFDEKLVIAGDMEFFLRAAWRRNGHHVPEVLGLYYEGGIESQNLDRCRIETEEVLGRYRTMVPIEDVYPACRRYPDREEARAVALLDFARCLTTGPHNDVDLAHRLRQEALKALSRASVRGLVRFGLMKARFRLKGGRRGRDSGRWHPVLFDLPPVADEIVRPLAPARVTG